MDAQRQLDRIRDRMPAFVVGGRLCLDFANTVEPRGGLAVSSANRARANQRDYLRDYADVLLWALLAEAIPARTATDLLNMLAHSPEDAGALYGRAIALREAIYAGFWRLAHGDQPSDDDRATIANEYRTALTGAELAPAGDGRFAWSWPDAPALDRPLGLIAASAVDLMVQGDPRRIKTCPGGPGGVIPCGWLFYDASRNRSRHWCTMADCGTATKTTRLTERRRAQRAADGGR